MSNQRYSPEFKDEAVRQIVDRGYSVAEVSERLKALERENRELKGPPLDANAPHDLASLLHPAAVTFTAFLLATQVRVQLAARRSPRG